MLDALTSPTITCRLRRHADSAESSGRVASEAATPEDAQTVLVVDDESDLVDLIALNLRRHGFRVETAGDGNAALKLAQQSKPDLVILDVMMPGLDGTEVARRLRAEPATQTLPILMLTAKTEETDEIVGLSVGADDYVTKPFSPKVLMARVKALLRRTLVTGSDSPGEVGSKLVAGPLVIDLDKHEIRLDEKLVKLTLTEFKLLHALVEAKGRVLSRDRLMDKAMGTDVFVTDRAIDVHVTAIRKKLGDASWLVHTVRGVGYRLQETPTSGE
ncbi:MAG: response regulator transcription factor [Planctomycetota bacterium]